MALTVPGNAAAAVTGQAAGGAFAPAAESPRDQDQQDQGGKAGPGDKGETGDQGQPSVPDPELIAKLEKYLSGATLKGRYTILGSDSAPAEEEYSIQSAKKLPEGDQWLLEARIKYGKFDLTVPLKLTIKWADKTPVITVDKLTIPGMGTFSARVLFNSEMYSGTWSHDEVRGHLFGRVIPAGGAEAQAQPPGQ
jgi:hypothetical protein